MKHLNSYDNMILEKRISQISSKMEVVFNYDIIKTKHSKDRQDFKKRGIKVGNQNYISNDEIIDFVLYFRKEISEAIINGDIASYDSFLIRSFDRELSMVINAKRVEKTHWKLIIITIFRVSEEEPFRNRKGELVIDK